MPKTMNFKYYATAAILSAGWLVVLALPGWTRSWFYGDPGWWKWNILFLVIAGLSAAKLFRRPIGSARAFIEHLQMAVVVPHVGCIIYLTICNSWIWARHWLCGDLANLHNSLSLYLLGLSAALMAFFVVIPYGLFCQWVMNKVSA